jgi:trans-aconitate 2-methyltransferase
MTWSAAQYSKFEAERNRPIHDLLAHLPQQQISSAVDLGCGPGNSTEFLAARFPGAKITGLDSSTNMLDAARKRMPNATFELADIATWSAPGPFDVLFANAALQWVASHETLLPALIAKLAPGGSLAVQMPDNLDEPAHRLMREVAAEGPWTAKLADAAGSRAPRHDASWYVRVIKPHASVDIWQTTYFHSLANAEAIVEWFRGSGLRPFVDPLDDAERAAYLSTYTKAITAAYPALPDGTVLLPFPRLFFIATK